MGKGMGSLTAMLPGGMMLPGCPLKARGMEELGLMAPVGLGAAAGRAAAAWSMMRGLTPSSLVRTTRRVGPPRETWTIWRRVVGMVKAWWSLTRAMGAVPQVATQLGCVCAIAGRVRAAASSRDVGMKRTGWTPWVVWRGGG